MVKMVKRGSTPWAKLWKSKYAPSYQTKYLVRLSGAIHWSDI